MDARLLAMGVLGAAALAGAAKGSRLRRQPTTHPFGKKWSSIWSLSDPIHSDEVPVLAPVDSWSSGLEQLRDIIYPQLAHMLISVHMRSGEKYVGWVPAPISKNEAIRAANVYADSDLILILQEDESDEGWDTSPSDVDGRRVVALNMRDILLISF